MKKINLFISLLLFFILLMINFTSIVNAANNNVDIEFLRNNIEVQPQQVLTIPLKVTNNTLTTKELNDKIIVPTGWNIIKSPSFFSLNKGENEIRLISVIVPNSVAGIHKISYVVNDQEGFFYKKDIDIKVLSNYELNVITRKIPDYIIAGQLFEVEYIVSNLSNEKININFEIENDEDWNSFILSSDVIELGIGESEKIILKVKANEKVRKTQKKSIKLKAVITKNNGEELAYMFNNSLEVIAIKSGIDDKYKRLPIDLSFNTNYKNNGIDYLLELSGFTYLNEGETDYVNLFVASPEVVYSFEENRYSKLYEEKFSLDLNIDNRIVLLGDNYYTLSPLTEENRYGRGIYISSGSDDYNIFGYYSNNIYGNSWAVSGKYFLNDMIDLQANYLNKYVDEKNADYNIWSIRTYINKHKNIDAQFEYAWANNDNSLDIGTEKEFGKAWRTEVEGNYQDLDFNVEMYNANSAYPGEYSDVNKEYISLRYPLIQDNLFVWGNYKNIRRNLDLNQDLKTASNKSGYQIGFTHKHRYNGSYSYSYGNYSFYDRFIPSSYNDEKEMNHFNFSQSLNNFSIYSFYDWGKNINKITNISEDISNYGFSAFYYPLYKQRYKLYYNNFDDYDFERINKEEAGVSATFIFTDDTGLTLNLSRESRNKELSDIISLSLDKDLSIDNSIFIKGSYKNNEESEYEYTISLSYLYKNLFGIPIGLREVGSIHGKVYDLESPNKDGIEGIVIRINNTTAVTDENGEYVFPSLAPGEYYISVDKGTIGFNKVTAEVNPFELSINAQENKELDFGIIRSAKITGNISRFEYDDNLKIKQEYILHEVGGAGNIVVELLSDRERYTVTTDEEGKFMFEDLRPGKWIVNILETSGIPENYHFEKKQYVINIKPGVTKNISTRLVPKNREIIFIEDAEL